MNHTMTTVTRQSEGRYLYPEETLLLQRYVEDLPHRIAVYQSLQQKEGLLLDTVLAKFQPTLPQLTKQHGANAWQRCRRDLSMVWRYCCLAMLLNDEDYLRDKLLYWLETILKSFKMRDQCHPAYRLMLDSLRTVLAEEEVMMIRPYVLLSQTMLMG